LESPHDYHYNHHLYQQRAASNPNHSHFYEDEPMSPAIQTDKRPNIRRSKRLEHKNIESPPIGKQPRSQPIKQAHQPDSPGIAPSIPPYMQRQNATNKNLSPMKLPYQQQQTKVVQSSKCKMFGTLLSMLFVIASVVAFFVVFDGMDKVYEGLNELNDFIEAYGVEEKIPFCDSNSNSIGDSEVECLSCPEYAIVCRNGGARCKTNYVLQDDKCVLDGVIVKFAYDLGKQVKHLLSERRGKYECNEMEHDDDGYAMKRDELISNCKILDESKKDEAFDYFEMHILSESSIVSKTEQNAYYSHKAIKSPQCKIMEMAQRNILGLVSTIVVIAIVIAIGCRQKTKKKQNKTVDAMIGAVYNILEEYRFNQQRHVPIDVIKQRVVNQFGNAKLWKRVDAVIQTDPSIVRSMRMVDGMQKKCLALTSVQSLNTSNNQSAYKPNSSWSHSQQHAPQQQPPQPSQSQSQSWNFNNRNQQNEGGSGYAFGRGGSQSDRSEQAQFPEHSKRNMWK